MKVTFKIMLVMALCLLGSMFSGLYATDVDLNNPQDVQQNIKLDYHPDYGVVTKYDMPVDSSGWDNSKLTTLFEGKDVVNYEVKEELFSGIALAEHKDSKGNIFYVWHEYKNEKVAHITADIRSTDGQIYRWHIIIIIICSNGMIWIIIF